MDLVTRVQGLILKPKEEWEKIKAETTSVSELFKSYAMILAAIPAVAQFIGLGLVGRRMPYVGLFKMGVGTALLYAVFSYIFALATAYLFGLIINALAPKFSSAQNMVNAMKLSVYSMTPAWVAGVFNIIPALGVLAVLGSLYGLYILYLGFSAPLMETPKEKVMSYLIISIVVVVVLSIVVGVVLGAIFVVRGVTGTL